MAMQVLVNLFIAALWMFLQDEWSFLSFFSGYIVGIFILFLIRRFFDDNFYIVTFMNILSLLLVFIHELFTSSMEVVKQVIKPKLDIRPGIFTLETELEGDIELALLSFLLCITPGSVVVEVGNDNKTFYVHGLDIPTSSESLLKSKVRFEKSIKRVTGR
ncbi:MULTISPECIES: Na+/H+ antiporter subunit E [Cytobacillus]|uniref:Na+/H+ antiporter subunit E n=1 Tax=Cytobacillus TaxID=2675230 RepID=UPI001CD7362E|nr:Na+/H+ antiporter subunit E [Cytobacillus kochii]MCA1025337.1 Na+/H+ antiporter subunit E [Cytobacillus kochii]MCM3323245.1 Na+/H+ antiporter subunit E [Cytobacillus kochii]MCM3345640.1 Na+/H+ antiporter subunit E [Cytobacillus kochii]MDM5208618.1 Na+/H+ antiporter subunit E [Cytobacillus kochii]